MKSSVFGDHIPQISVDGKAIRKQKFAVQIKTEACERGIIHWSSVVTFVVFDVLNRSLVSINFLALAKIFSRDYN